MVRPIRHQRLMKEHADPADDTDLGALSVAAKIAVAVFLVVLVSLFVGGDDLSIGARAAGGSSQTSNAVAGFTTQK